MTKLSKYNFTPFYNFVDQCGLVRCPIKVLRHLARPAGLFLILKKEHLLNFSDNSLFIRSDLSFLSSLHLLCLQDDMVAYTILDGTVDYRTLWEGKKSVWDRFIQFQGDFYLLPLIPTEELRNYYLEFKEQWENQLT